MEQKYFDAVISEMKTLLDGQKFVADGEIFKNENKAVKINYNTENKQFELFVADITDNNIGEFAKVNSWLFDETQNEKDAAAVGVDFSETLRTYLGLKKSASKNVSNVELPSVNKGDAVTVTTLTQKLLAIFPQYKDEYKQSVADNGRFLYLEFFMKKFAPEIKKMLSSKANKKQIKKLFDMLIEMYVEGDNNTVEAVVALISSSVYGDDTCISVMKEQLSDCSHLAISVKEMLGILKHNKKLQTALSIN